VKGLKNIIKILSVFHSKVNTKKLTERLFLIYLGLRSYPRSDLYLTRYHVLMCRYLGILHETIDALLYALYKEISLSWVKETKKKSITHIIVKPINIFLLFLSSHRSLNELNGTTK